MANCRGCGAEIFWAETTAGRAVPLDAKPESRFVGSGSKTIATSTTPSRDVVKLQDTYLSHFATCPKAGEFRK